MYAKKIRQKLRGKAEENLQKMWFTEKHVRKVYKKVTKETYA